MADKPFIVVTGASRGLGAAIARWLGKAGAGVTRIARIEEKLRHTAETVRQLDGDALIQEAEVSDPDAWPYTIISQTPQSGSPVE